MGAGVAASRRGAKAGKKAASYFRPCHALSGAAQGLTALPRHHTPALPLSFPLLHFRFSTFSERATSSTAKEDEGGDL